MTKLCDYLPQSKRYIYNEQRLDPDDKVVNRIAQYFNGVFVYMAGVGTDNKYRSILYQEDMEEDIYGRPRTTADLTTSTEETWHSCCEVLLSWMYFTLCVEYR
jgi:hypothetical protein